MNDQKQQLIERLKQAQNVLVTVSTNPSVDQLAAAIGLTLLVNNMEKHGTAVFSGAVPSTIEFLKPEETLEKNTDSLRDFIIALDKSKADKLRYKVEDQVVRIFITPYRTAINEKDLEFSQGDFNVDVVVALGVQDPNDLDTAITAHGRILHDATVASVSTEPNGNLGTIHWTEAGASSLSEMITHLAGDLDKKALDNQTATALLTGIVAATKRFSNDKTTPDTMNASATLMAAGANQQLIVTQLETPPPEPPRDEPPQNDEPAPDDNGGDAPQAKREPGTLEIDHEGDEAPAAEPAPAPEPRHPEIEVDEEGRLISEYQKAQAPELPQISVVHGVSNDGSPAANEAREGGSDRQRMAEAPQFNTPLTANSENDEDNDQPAENLTRPDADLPLLSHDEVVLPPVVAPAPIAPPEPAVEPTAPPEAPASQPPVPPAPEPVAPPQSAPAVTPQETLSELEQEVNSPHLQQPEPLSDETTAGPDVDRLRDQISAAYSEQPPRVEPISALNAQPLGEPLHEAPAPAFDAPAPEAASPAPTTVPNTGFSEPTPGNSPADEALDMPLPGTPLGPQPAAIQPGTPQAFPPQASAPYQPSQPVIPQPVVSPYPATPSSSPGAFPGAAPQAPLNSDPNAPPPVPPPMLPPLQ